MKKTMIIALLAAGFLAACSKETTQEPPAAPVTESPKTVIAPAQAASDAPATTASSPMEAASTPSVTPESSTLSTAASTVSVTPEKTNAPDVSTQTVK